MPDPLPFSPVAPYGLGTRGLQKSNNAFGTHPDLTEPSVEMLLARTRVAGCAVAADLGARQTASGWGSQKERAIEEGSGGR